MDELELFLILGIRGSGRKAAFLDLIDGYYANDKKISVLLHESESFESELPENVECIPYRLSPGKLLFPNGIPSADTIFIVNDGAGNCVDFLENVRDWCKSKKLTVSRIVTFAHVEKILEHPKIARWYEAAINFSDVVFLNNRPHGSDKEIRKFVDKYNRELALPCLFEFIKKGKIKNPAIAVEGYPRRLSQAFDEQEHEYDLTDVTITDENDESLEDDQEFLNEFQNAAEPYFEKHPNGRRVKEIPDISELLS